MEENEKPKSILPLYATYSYWFFIALVVALIILVVFEFIQTYKLQAAVEVLWRRVKDLTIFGAK
jgi:hypothetical protein